MSKILLLEDDLSLIKGLSFAFFKQGYELEVARTVREAEAVWADGRYDLLILDVSLPDGSGFEVCKIVRQTSKMPIIFLTASGEVEDVIGALLLGAVDYLKKPYPPKELLKRVAQEFEKR